MLMCGRLFLILLVSLCPFAVNADSDALLPMNTDTMSCIDIESARDLLKVQGESWDEKITDAEWKAARVLLRPKCKYHEAIVTFAELVPLAVYDTTDSSKIFFAAASDEQILVYEGMKINEGRIFDVCDTIENGKTALEIRLSSLEEDKVRTAEVYTSKHCRAGKATKNLIIFPLLALSRDIELSVDKNGMHHTTSNSFIFGQMLEKGKVVYVVTGRQYD
jgi:hypothetical protein